MPTGRRGQLLALSLLFVALGGLYLVVVSPLLGLYAERAAVLENRRMLVPRLRAAADELPTLRARVEQLRAAAGTRKITLEGASDAIAAATLQSRIEELATSAGATIGSTESLPAKRARAIAASDCATSSAGPTRRWSNSSPNSSLPHRL
jgi:hypothetical protein